MEQREESRIVFGLSRVVTEEDRRSRGLGLRLKPILMKKGLGLMEDCRACPAFLPLQGRKNFPHSFFCFGFLSGDRKKMKITVLVLYEKEQTPQGFTLQKNVCLVLFEKNNPHRVSPCRKMYVSSSRNN